MTKRTITVVFLAATIFCLCFIQAILGEQNRMMSENYELTAQPEDGLKNSTVQAVKLIDGVAESSSYMTGAFTLTVGGCSINVTVHGLSTDYKINGRYTLGSGLILNQAAIDAIKDEFQDNKKTFTDYFTPKYSLGSDELLFGLDMVIENKSDDEAPVAYLSVNQMGQLMKKLGKNSEADLLIIKLVNYSYLDYVKDELDDLDLTIISNTNAIKEEADTYNIHILYLSIIMAVSLLAVTASHKEVDGSTLIIGYFMGTAATVCLPYLFSPAQRNATVFGLSASSWFYFVVFAAIALIIALKEVYGRFFT